MAGQLAANPPQIQQWRPTRHWAQHRRHWHAGSMRGTDATTGRALAASAHIRQSIRDILTTPIGTRVMRRDYGSEIYKWVDMPLTPPVVLAIISAAASAIDKWEPRIKLLELALVGVNESHARFKLHTQHIESGELLELDVEVTA